MQIVLALSYVCLQKIEKKTDVSCMRTVDAN